MLKLIEDSHEILIQCPPIDLQSETVVIRIGIICARLFVPCLSLSFSTRFPNEVSKALFSDDVEQPADIGLSKNVERTNERTYVRIRLAVRDFKSTTNKIEK